MTEIYYSQKNTHTHIDTIYIAGIIPVFLISVIVMIDEDTNTISFLQLRYSPLALEGAELII